MWSWCENNLGIGLGHVLGLLVVPESWLRGLCVEGDSGYPFREMCSR